MTESVETYQWPAHGIQCFFCGEVFTTPGTASDHFGAANHHGYNLSEPGCLIDFKVQLELGGTPERGRGLLMTVRQLEQEIRENRSTLEKVENELSNAQVAHFDERRKIGELIRPGRTVEELIELFHGIKSADHGGLVLYCDKWPCVWIQWHHQFTPTREEKVELALKDNCIICGMKKDNGIHV